MSETRRKRVRLLVDIPQVEGDLKAGLVYQIMEPHASAIVAAGNGEFYTAQTLAEKKAVALEKAATPVATPKVAEPVETTKWPEPMDAAQDAASVAKKSK